MTKFIAELESFIVDADDDVKAHAKAQDMIDTGKIPVRVAQVVEE